MVVDPFNYYSFFAGELWQDGAMAKKRKLKKFRKVEAVKALARERIGTPRASQAIPDGRERNEKKHKTTLKKLLAEND